MTSQPIRRVSDARGRIWTASLVQFPPSLSDGRAATRAAQHLRFQYGEFTVRMAHYPTAWPYMPEGELGRRLDALLAVSEIGGEEIAREVMAR